MTCLHYLKIVQKIIITEQHKAREDPSQTRMVVITLRHISVLSESGQDHLWRWGTFGNTKSSRPRTPRIPQNLGDAILVRLAPAIQKHWSYEPEIFGNIKNYAKNYWSHNIVEKYAPLSWIGRFPAITTYQIE